MTLHRFFLPLAALFLTPAASAWSGASTLDCSSTDRRTVHCPVDTRGGVALIHQHSRAPCIEGHSWGWDRRGVWVSEGCRGEFVVGTGHAGGWNGRPGRHAALPQQQRCESLRQQTAWCPMDTRQGVVLVHQLSRGACIERRSWGWDQRGVWVSHGCRAEFETGGWGGRPPHWDRGSGWDAPAQVVRCESNRGRVQYCAIGSARSIRLQRQFSRDVCREGQTWGWDRRGLWVSHGCRGEFVVW